MLEGAKRLPKANARTKQHLLCKTKPISKGLLTTVTSALTSTYDKKTTPGVAKKQSQFKTNWQKGRDRQTSPNTSYQFRGTLLRAYKAPLAGVPPLQAPRAHKTIPFMQNKANLPRAANGRNLSYNKHLRTQTTPGGPKKQSQFKPNQNQSNPPTHRPEGHCPGFRRTSNGILSRHRKKAWPLQKIQI